MATHSTIPTFKKLLVAKARTALTVPAFYAWPGPACPNEAFFLGPHPDTRDIRIDTGHQLPVLSAARKSRQEQYTVRATVWEFRPDLTADGAETCEQAAFDVAGDVEDLLADDPALGSTDIQWARVAAMNSTLFPFQKGWACELGLDVEVNARLT